MKLLEEGALLDGEAFWECTRDYIGGGMAGTRRARTAHLI